MDHFLYSHYNQVSDQASYKNSCFFSFGGLGVYWAFSFVCIWFFKLFMFIFTIPTPF